MVSLQDDDPSPDRLNEDSATFRFGLRLNVTVGVYTAYVLGFLASLHFLFASPGNLRVLFAAVRTGSFNAFLLLVFLTPINWVLFRALGPGDAKPSPVMIALTSARIAFVGALYGGIKAYLGV
jgi:hypothetical protein